MTEVLSGCGVRAAVQAVRAAEQQQAAGREMSPELQVALVNLREAVDFMKRCRADMKTAGPTGAWRDAVEWIEEAAGKVVAALPPGLE